MAAVVAVATAGLLSQEILRRPLEAKTLSSIAITAGEGDFRYTYAD